MRRLACALVPFLAAACAGAPAAPPAPDALTSTVGRVVTTAPLDQIHWGVLFMDASTGRPLYALNPDRKFVPASNRKIPVTAAALSLLGPDFRWETSLWAVGSVDSTGTLRGDLVLPGSGDPTLSERYHPTALAPLDSLAAGVAGAGIRRVAGRLVVDASRWDTTSVPGSWMVGNLPWRYSATGGPFAVAEGELEIEVTAGHGTGDAARIHARPPADTAFLASRVRTVAPGEDTDLEPEYLPESRRILLTGTIEAGTVDTVRVAARDPVRLAGSLLLEALRRHGVEVKGGLRVAASGDTLVRGGCSPGHVPECPRARRVARSSSPPLGEIVAGILEPSQNWMTEQLLRTLGLVLGEGGSWEEGFRVERAFLQDTVGVDSLDVHQEDGSGMSAYNLLTPRAVVAVLDHMRRSAAGPAYRDALAEPGEEDSTLERRLEGLEGRLWAKTGTISHVNALSGYLVTDGGRTLVFSVLTNGSGLPSSMVREGIDRIVRAAASLP